jgi:hypothetical protein
MTIIGACARCGAPIYTESMWMGITPPPSYHSCTCFPAARGYTTTTIVIRGDTQGAGGEG